MKAYKIALALFAAVMLALPVIAINCDSDGAVVSENSYAAAGSDVIVTYEQYNRDSDGLLVAVITGLNYTKHYDGETTLTIPSYLPNQEGGDGIVRVYEIGYGAFDPNSEGGHVLGDRYSTVVIPDTVELVSPEAFFNTQVEKIIFEGKEMPMLDSACLMTYPNPDPGYELTIIGPGLSREMLLESGAIVDNIFDFEVVNSIPRGTVFNSEHILIAVGAIILIAFVVWVARHATSK